MKYSTNSFQPTFSELSIKLADSNNNHSMSIHASVDNNQLTIFFPFTILIYYCSDFSPTIIP